MCRTATRHRWHLHALASAYLFRLPDDRTTIDGTHEMVHAIAQEEWKNDRVPSSWTRGTANMANDFVSPHVTGRRNNCEFVVFAATAQVYLYPGK